MSESTRRVVLLARPGVACERLRSALGDAGVQLVLEADPTTLEPSALSAAAPEVVVVALDPVTEDALDRFEPVLVDPRIEVIFEEAELAAAREGWDAARWVRHLAAKLHRHGDVLPPGHEPEDVDDTHAAATPDRVVEPVPIAPVAAPVAAPVSSHAFDPVMAELSDAPPPTIVEPVADFAFVPTDAMATDEITIAPFESSFDYDDAPVAATPAPAVLKPAPVLVFEASLSAVPPVAAAPTEVVAPAAPDWSFADEAPALQGLLDREGGSDGVADGRLRHDLDEIERRISSLELVDDRPATHVNGAVLVLAGIGGPDAVRQLLGALPETFAWPVLVQQRLDGGRYDKLVAQMQRATPLLVKLAEPGVPAIGGVIYILPAGVGIAVDEAGIRFDDAGADVLAALPAADSAVLLLSGSDPGRVDAAMNHAWAGALVAGQAPDGCYDAVAAMALIARGGESGQPAELAARLSARWA
ncbi:chemotaxis protein CheB [Lysobacter cavernae]|uniref:Chemotaxis protein CheB n=1 Tax=Lysobacter cavernae TaxID=1685901 RepID=A0ABV7RT82_9GAMM